MAGMTARQMIEAISSFLREEYGVVSPNAGALTDANKTLFYFEDLHDPETGEAFAERVEGTLLNQAIADYDEPQSSKAYVVTLWEPGPQKSVEVRADRIITDRRLPLAQLAIVDIGRSKVIAVPVTIVTNGAGID